MKKNYLLVFITTFLLTFISVAYAAFNSELSITGEGTIQKDEVAPTCGAWYLRDSDLTIQQAYNQNKFKNPGTNTTWTNKNQKLFIQCTDNMEGNYGCINVTEITDSNNQKRYYKEVKEYNTTIQTDSNVVTVTLQDAYLNSTTCTLPVGGSNPYLDKEAPEVTITPTSYNKFTYSATDDVAVTGYMVTTSPVEPTIDDENWIEEPVEVTIDNAEAHTYYVWAKDGANVSNETINTWLLTKTQGEGTTLTLKYNDNNGIDLPTGYVLDETNIYVSASLDQHYTDLTLTKNNTSINNPSTQTITAATTIESSALFNGIFVTFNSNGGNVVPASKEVVTGEPYGELPTPTKTGYRFDGWSYVPSDYQELEYIESTGTQYINTGISGDTIYGFDYKFIPTGNVDSYDSYLGGTLDDFTLGRFISNDVAYIRYRTEEVTHTLTIDTNTINSISIKNNIARGNHEQYSVSTSSPLSNGSGNLIVLNNASFSRNAKAKVYSLILYNQNNEVIMYLLPCRRSSDGAIGLYDLVSDTFYGNSGTGTFVGGPSKGTVTNSTIVTEEQDHTLYAQWTRALSVTFDANGGSVSPASKLVVTGETYGELPTPTKTGYRFDGWSYVPSDYQELEYIEGTGTQYINSNYIFTSSKGKIDSKFIYTQNVSSPNFNSVYGVEKNTSPYQTLSIRNQAGTMQVLAHGSYVSSNISLDAMYTVSQTFNGTTNTVDINGTVSTSNGSEIVQQSNLYIFADNLNGTASRFGYLKLYYLKIYDASGVLVRDYIPVKKISTGKVGLYDLVSGTFYGNSGTGDFVSGPSKGTVTSSTIVTEEQDHTLYAQWSAPLIVTFNANGGEVSPASKEIYYKEPYGELPTPTKTGYEFGGWTIDEYQELQYIESTGTQYINTNYYVTKNTAIDVDFKFNSLTQQQRVYGVAGDVAYQFYINSANNWAYAYNDTSGNWFNTAVAANMNRHNLKFNVTSGKILIDNGSTYNNDISGTVTKTANYPLYIMVNNETGTVNCQGSEKIYFFKIYESGTLVRNYIPVRRLSDNAVGLLDKINNVFYANAGTGNFIAGPEVNRNIITSSSIVNTSQNHTLNAIWKKIYTLSIDPNGGTYNSSSSVTTANVGYSDVYNITNPTRSGYSFLGWKELQNTNSTTGLSDIVLYNNKGNGVVTVTSQQKSSDNPISLTSSEYKITNSGSAAASPGLGGFRQLQQTEPNHTYVHVFVAKLPVGYYFYEAYNSLGTGYSVEWLTSNEGTGNWQTYIYKVKAGSSGSFSTMGYVYVTHNINNIWNGATEETGSYTAYLAYSSTFDITNNSNGIGQLDGTATLTARWGTTLTVNPNGGNFNGSTSTTTYTQDVNSLRVLPVPTRTGYTFNGWTKSGGGTVTKYGNPLYTDDTFASGTNSMGVYNNAGGGTVVHSRVATTSDNPLKKSSYVMKITTSGAASPGLGGFVQSTSSSANAVFYHVIVAKIPIGYSIQHAENATGTGRVITWLTPQEGTGRYETYIYKHQCGSSGTFSTFGHVWISGNAATSTNPVTWYVAFANMFNASSSPNNSSQVFTYGESNTTLTANWTANTFTVAYNGNGATGGSTTSHNCSYDGACSLKSNGFTRSGYTFTGWKKANSGSTMSAGTSIKNAATSGTVTYYAQWTLSSVFAYLGQGTSINVKNSYPQHYSSLTADNFIVVVQSMPALSAQGWTNPHQYLTASFTGFNVSKSYNASTGVLTISGNSYRVWGCYDDSYIACGDANAYGSVSPLVYLRYNYSNFYDLGTGTSFNIKSKYPSFYSSLSANNFIVGTTSIGNLYAQGWTNPHQYIYTNTNGFTVSKSYNASTGILTVSGNSYNVKSCGDDYAHECGDAQTTGSFSPRVYLYR